MSPLPAPPSWINPAFRLLVAGVAWSWPVLAERAMALGDGPIIAHGRDIAGVAAALIAGWVRATPVALLRGGLPAPADMPSTGRLLLLESSGTTGLPKRITRPFDAVLSGVEAARDDGGRWLLTYDPCGFAGLQVLLTVMRGGGTLLANPDANAASLIGLAVAEGATHISATPSFWRLLLLTGATPPLARITLGGEAADPAVLDGLRARFPDVPVRCIYASTERGRLFTVSDGQPGFPARWLTHPPGPFSFRIQNDILWVQQDGQWHNTGDLVEVVGERVLFHGRNDMLVNVGGSKVNPALAEDRLLSLPGVDDALVYGIPSAVTGSLLAADLVAPAWQDDAGWRGRVSAAVADLPPAARPRRWRLVSAIPLSPAGKKRRLQEEA